MTANEGEPKKTGVSGWLSDILAPLVTLAVDRAIADLHTEIKSDLVDMENKLLSQFTQLPGMVASQVQNVALDAEQVAEQVATRFGQFLNPQGLAQQIIQGIIPGLPHFPGFGVHADDSAYNKPSPEAQMKAERTAGTTQEPVVRKSKASEIRKRLEERDPNKLPRKDRP